MNYALVEDGVITTTNLPTVGILPDGSHVSGFDKLPPDILKTAGWLPIIESDPPTINPETQAYDTRLEIHGDLVRTVYDVYDIPPPPAPEEEIVPTRDLVEQLIDTLVEKKALNKADADKVRGKKPT